MTEAGFGSGADADQSAEFAEAVRDAAAEKRGLYLRGGDSKRSLCGRCCEETPLVVSGHRGILRYNADEMVMTARAGTPVAELAAAAAARRQQLPFDPGLFGGRATIGGTLACNLSGPARPWQGSVRDAVLGIRLINGHGEVLRFGGEVIKNVAGYDVSRLQAGALGTLGLISEVSLRLLPASVGRIELQAELPAADALARMRALARRPIPLRGACWWRQRLYLSIEGGDALVSAMAGELADFDACDDPPWDALREWTLPGVTAGEPMWSLHLAPAAALDPSLPPLLIDWAGARRLYQGDLSRDQADAMARAGGGQAQRFGAGLSRDYPGPSMSPVLRQLHRRIKRALDPHNVFNRGRLYDWL